MFFTEDDNSVYVTRGDTVVLSLTAESDSSGEAYCFKVGDVVRIKVFEKKNCENVVLQKDFGIEETTDTVQLTLTGDDTRIGGVISKPVDYWYEIELNPDISPQTIIGYDDEGPRLFKLMPEGKDVDKTPPITPQDIPVVDDELSLTSKRPVQNKVVTGVIAEISENIDKGIEEKVNAAASQVNGDISLLKTRIDVLTSTKIPTSAIEQEVADARVEADGTVNSNLGEAVRNAYNKLFDIIFAEKIKKADSVDLETDIADGTYLTKLVTYKGASLTSEDSYGIYVIVAYTGVISLTKGEILNVWCFKGDKIYKLNYDTEDFEEINKTVTVDSELSSTSRNPVENRAVVSALSDKVDKAEGKALSSNDFTDALNQKLNGIESGANKTVTDSALSSTSLNPVENKAITAALNKKLNLSGGTMSGNLGMGGKDILNVKKIIFISENGEWLNMGNHSITNLATPTADHHAVNKAYVDNALVNIPKITVDTELSNTSENPVENKAIKAEFDKVDSAIKEIKPIVTSEIPFGIVKNSYVTKDGVITPYQGWDRTEPVICEGLTAFKINVDDYGGNEYNAFYDADNQFITNFSSWKETINVPKNAVTFLMSAPASALAKFKIIRDNIDKKINDFRKYVDNTKPTLITFNNADFANDDTQKMPIKIDYGLAEQHILLMVTFDISRLNFTIPEGADFSITKALINGEAFDLSLLDNYIKRMELFSEDYGENWIVDGNNYTYIHEYNFSTTTNAQAAYEELQASLNLTGFQLLINNYHCITAKEV